MAVDVSYTHSQVKSPSSSNWDLETPPNSIHVVPHEPRSPFLQQITLEADAFAPERFNLDTNQVTDYPSRSRCCDFSVFSSKSFVSFLELFLVVLRSSSNKANCRVYYALFGAPLFRPFTVEILPSTVPKGRNRVLSLFLAPN